MCPKHSKPSVRRTCSRHIYFFANLRVSMWMNSRQLRYYYSSISFLGGQAPGVLQSVGKGLTETPSTLAKTEIIYPKNVGALVVMKFTQNELSAPIAIEKIKIPGALLELPAKQHCQSSTFTSKIGPNWPNWQCFLAGSSKTAPRILIFSAAMGAKP